MTFKTSFPKGLIREANFGAAARAAALPAGQRRDHRGEREGRSLRLPKPGARLAPLTRPPPPRTLPGSSTPTRLPASFWTRTAWKRRVWPRPGGAEVARGVAGPEKLSENEAARPAADLLRGSGARVPSADRDATKTRAHSPRPFPGRGFVSALATPTSSSSSPKPTNPGRVPTEALAPPPEKPLPRRAPRLEERRGGVPTRVAKAHAQVSGRGQRGREPLLRGRKLQAAERLQSAPPGGAEAREGGASGEQ